jgi:hypothetical protein
MNPIDARVKTGTIGELLVQIRLLQYGIQAAAPLKDSGNDLIAVCNDQFRAVSVRTTTTGTFTRPSDRRYHVLAVVSLQGEDNTIHLDTSELFLIRQDLVNALPTRCENLRQFVISERLVRDLFGNL